MREDLRIYVEDVVENIDSLNGYKLTNYLMDEVLRANSYEIDEENTLDISSYSDKLGFLMAVYENIKRPEDQQLFIREVLDNERYLDSRIVEEFRGMAQVPEGFDDTEDSNEEPEEEQELEETNPTLDDDTIVESNPVEEKPEELEEEKVEEIVEGPAITEYKAKTAEMEKELEELMAKLNNLSAGENTLSEMDEIINNTSYPEIEEKDNQIDNIKEEIENIEKNIADKTLEKERYEKLKEDYNKYYEDHNIPKTNGDYREKMDIYDKRIKESNDVIKSLTEKKIYKSQELEMLIEKKQGINGPLYNIEKWKFSELFNKEIEQLENSLKELNEIQDELYKESKGIPLEIYGMKTKIENQIHEMKDTYNRITGIRSDINLNSPEFKPVIDTVKSGRKINEEVQELLQTKFGKEPKENIDNKDLKELIEKTKEEIEKRKENIAKYYDALNDIKNIGNEIKSGKTPEELKENIEQINNKIETITDDKLKEELKGELNKALNPEIKKEVPEKAGEVKKDPNKWKKWMSGLAGLALGAGIIALTPLTGIAGGLAVLAGSQAVKFGVNKVHNHLVKKAQELPKENEVNNIEKTGKLAQFKEKLKGWFLDENIVKNINWFLNGTSIGAMSMGLLEASTGINYGDWTAPKVTTTETIAPEMTSGPTSTTAPAEPGISVGDSASGMDLSTGYDSSNWAINGTNAESLNQGIMNDGQTVVRRIMDAQGNTYMSTEEALKAGKSLQELSFDLATKTNLDRAWVNAADAVGRTL